MLRLNGLQTLAMMVHIYIIFGKRPEVLEPLQYKIINSIYYIVLIDDIWSNIWIFSTKVIRRTLIILFFFCFLYSQGGGYALEFDGVNDNINIGDINNLDGASTFTIEFWFDINNLNNMYSLINKRQSANESSIQIKYHTTKGFIMEVETGNSAFCYLDSYSTYDEWVHASVVYNGSGGSNEDKLELYLNGAAQTLTFYSSLPSVSHSNSNPVYLGSIEGSSQFFPGKMDAL